MQRSRNFVKNLNWLEADKLALYKEKEEFDLRTSGLQDQAFSTAQIQIKHFYMLKLIYENLSIFGMAQTIVYFPPFTEANHRVTKREETRFEY